MLARRVQLGQPANSMTIQCRRAVRNVVVAVPIAIVLAAGSLYVILTSDWAARRVQSRMIAFLEERFDAEVEIASVSIALVPRLAIEGRDLTLRRRAARDPEPFIRLQSFRVTGGPLGWLRRRVALTAVDGFEVRIERGGGHTSELPPPKHRDVTVEHLDVRNGTLLIVPRDARKPPLQFDIEHVDMQHFGFDRAATFRARMSNPRPRGRIDATGTIGPWDTQALGSTSVAGAYTFSDAELSTIGGLLGTLTSTGSFAGVLERISVQGETSTPDFGLTVIRQPIGLETRFRAVVDGTNGDTYLEEVRALLGRTAILAKGAVTGTPGLKGRTVSLAVEIDDGRLEDVLRLTVRSAEPPMVGTLALESAFTLPPGDASVPDRLHLQGTFRISGAQFTSPTVQRRVDSLSRRGRGQPTNQNVKDVVSNFGGAVSLRNGRVHLPRLRFQVTGAAVDLGGSYRLTNAELDFAGSLTLDAPLSRTTTGFKSLLLRMADPFFRKRGKGAFVPIKIDGTVQQPSFGLDMRRVFQRGGSDRGSGLRAPRRAASTP